MRLDFGHMGACVREDGYTLSNEVRLKMGWVRVRYCKSYVVSAVKYNLSLVSEVT
jgi:hypothetical protein